MNDDISAYERQGFGAAMAPKAPYGLLIVDLVNGFADPAVFGGGNIPEAIARTVGLLAHARQQLAGGPQPHRVRRRRRRPQHLHAQGAGHADLEGSGPQQRHRAAARARFRGAGGAQDGAFRVLRHQPGRLAVTARGADAAGRRRGHQRLRAGQRGGRHAVRLSPAGGVGLRGRPRHRPARGQSLRHAAEVRHRADAGRSLAGDAGLSVRGEKRVAPRGAFPGRDGPTDRPGRWRGWWCHTPPGVPSA